MTGFLATLRTLPAMLGIGLALLVASFFIGDHRGANRVKDRVAAERAAANEQALKIDGGAKEQAATERAADTATITDIQRNQDHAIQGATDDADLRRRAACQRLRASRGDQAAASSGC